MGKRGRERTDAEMQADTQRTGRPPKKPSQRQTERITVNVTSAERKRLEKLAKGEGVPLSELIMLPWREKEGIE